MKTRNKALGGIFKKKGNHKKEIVTLDCAKKPNGSLGVKMKVHNTLQIQVFKAVCVGLAAMTTLSSLATNAFALDTSNTDSVQETTGVVEDNQDDSSILKDAKKSCDNLQYTWEQQKQLAEEDVRNAKALIGVTTQEVLDYYENSNTDDMTLRDEYMNILYAFSDLCDMIIEAVEQGDAETVQETLRQAEDLKACVEENKDIILTINMDTDDGVERITFDIEREVIEGSVLTVKATTSTLLWGEDMFIESSNDTILAPTPNPCQLLAVGSGTATVTITDNMGMVMYVADITVKEAVSDNTSGGTEQKPASIKKGDVDNDSEVTSADALMVLQNVVGVTELTDEQKSAADMDGDGNITSSDALGILQQVVGIAPATPETPPEIAQDTKEYYASYLENHSLMEGKKYTDTLIFGSRNSAEAGYVLKQLDDKFWDSYNYCWDWVDEEGVNLYADRRFGGDINFAHTFLTIQAMKGHFQDIGGINGDKGKAGYGSAYQAMIDGGDCDGDAQLCRALWWYYSNTNTSGTYYSTCLVTSKSMNHGWYCVKTPDGNQYHLEGSCVRDSTQYFPDDMVMHEWI